MPGSNGSVPADHEVRTTYRRALIHDEGTSWPQPGAVLGWWTRPDGIEMCRLRTFGTKAARWTVFDPDRIHLLVEGGT